MTEVLILLNLLLKFLIHIIVGRARPDFFWRCFPNGEITSDLHCTGDLKSELSGRMSFPSGHTSFAFTGFGFQALYIMGKFQVFNKRGHSLRLVISIFPLLIALLVGISRTCDYHHHWQDVTVGSMIGFGVTYLCYRQYYPALTDSKCYLSYTSQNLANNLRISEEKIKNGRKLSEDVKSSNNTNESVDFEKDEKWI